MKKLGGPESPPCNEISEERDSRPAGGTRGRAALVVAVAAINRLSADGGEGHFGRDSAAVARHADHLALTGATVAVAGHLPLVAAVLAALRLVREAALRIEGLLILAEHKFLSAIGAVEGLVVECIHEPLIS